VIDLSAGGNTLIRPQNYFTVPNDEDRLYIPEEFVALFVEQGWQKQPEAPTRKTQELMLWLSTPLSKPSPSSASRATA
jgi:hypothetical protein